MRPEEAEEMDAMDEKIVSLQCRLDRARKERYAARATVAELVTALTDALEWMKGRFGNADGTDWQDESAAAVADAVDAALAKAKEAKS